MRLFEWDKIYINPLYGKCRPQIDFPKLMHLYKKGDLKLDQMVTKGYITSSVRTLVLGMHRLIELDKIKFEAQELFFVEASKNKESL